MQPTAPMVVVVADHPLTRTFLERLLVDDGYRVAIAVGGAEGLAHVERGGAALVLLDLAAAVDDGLELSDACAHAATMSTCQS